MENDQIKAKSFAKIADIGKCNERAYYYETKAEMGNGEIYLKLYS